MGDHTDVNFVIVPGLVPLVDKQTGRNRVSNTQLEHGTITPTGHTITVELIEASIASWEPAAP
jgi:hypothetical protein